MASLLKRGKKYYAQYYIGNRQKRVSLNTENKQIAKEKIRKLESAMLREEEIPLPTKTPLHEIVEEYVKHIRTVKTPKSAQNDIYYLRETFGEICPELKCTSCKRTRASTRNLSAKGKRSSKQNAKVCVSGKTGVKMSVSTRHPQTIKASYL